MTFIRICAITYLVQNVVIASSLPDKPVMEDTPPYYEMFSKECVVIELGGKGHTK